MADVADSSRYTALPTVRTNLWCCSTMTHHELLASKGASCPNLQFSMHQLSAYEDLLFADAFCMLGRKVVT